MTFAISLNFVQKNLFLFKLIICDFFFLEVRVAKLYYRKNWSHRKPNPHKKKWLVFMSDDKIKAEIYKGFCLDVAQGHMNGAPHETRTHSWRSANQSCLPLHDPRRLW